MLILERLRVSDAELWQSCSVHALRLLHRFKARDFAHFLDVFDRDVLDDEGEPVLLSMHKADDVFFERVVGLLPMHVPKMTSPQVLRCLEVMVRRNIGSQRLFDHYILMMVEKHVLSYSIGLYSRMVRAMADKGFVEDYVFWDKFAFRYIFYSPKAYDRQRSFTESEARDLWESFVYLKLKCPTLDVSHVVKHLE